MYAHKARPGQLSCGIIVIVGRPYHLMRKQDGSTQGSECILAQTKALCLYLWPLARYPDWPLHASFLQHMLTKIKLKEQLPQPGPREAFHFSRTCSQGGSPIWPRSSKLHGISPPQLLQGQAQLLFTSEDLWMDIATLGVDSRHMYSRRNKK